MPRSPFLVWQAATEPHDAITFFVRTWAEAVSNQAPLARVARSRHHELMSQAERGEDWSPGDDIVAAQFRETWANEATLIWMAAQLERWLERYAESEGQSGPASTPHLRTLRNSLEHLDRALIEDGHASQGSGAWSLNHLPGGQLFLGSTSTDSAFGISSIDDIERAANAVLEQLADSE